MKTNALTPLMLLALATSLRPVPAQFSYRTNDGTITIYGYSGPGGHVEIPDAIDGLPVTLIAASP